MSERTAGYAYPANYWQMLVLTFCMGWTVIWIYRVMLSPIYLEMQTTIGSHSNAAMGMIASWYFLGYVALQVPAGYLSDRYGQKKVLVPGFCLFAFGVFLIAFAKSINIIYVGALLGGIGCGGYYGAAFSLTSRHVPPEKKGLQTAIVNSGSALGMVIGLLGSSYLVKSWGFPWQIMVFISGCLIVLLVFWFRYAIIDPNKYAPDRNIRAVNSSSGNPFFQPRLLSVCFLYFTTSYAYYVLITWLPKFMEEERSIHGGMIGMLVSLMAVTAVPGALYFARLSDRHRDKKAQLLLALQLVAFVLILGAVWATKSGTLAVALILYGFFGKFTFDPVLVSYVSDQVEPNELSKTFGTMNFFTMLSSVIAPALTGYIIDNFGSGIWGFYLGAILMLVGAVVFYWINVRGNGD